MMPRRPHPILLIFTLAVPTAASALGLGDIHVDSALNEPLSAQIDIVGASLDDLTSLRAAIANLETFQRYGADRPTFLNSATFNIGRDAQGRPVLNVRSRESFTDPLVTFLVDIRWGTSEMVREYSLLLDPVGFSAAHRMAEITSVAKVTVDTNQAANQLNDSAAAIITTPSSSIITTAPAIIAPSSRIIAPSYALELGSHHRITFHDTLRAIVRHAGARSETQVQRLMIATFRANPSAFDGNINRLHLGVVLNIPSSAEFDAITPADAKHEVDAQMTVWRAQAHHGIAHRSPVAAMLDATASASKSQTPVVQTQQVQAQDPSDAALSNRVQSLEQQLDDLHQQMANEYANIQDLKRSSARATLPAQTVQERAASDHVEVAATAPSAGAESQARSPRNINTVLGLAALLLGAVLVGYGYFRRRLQRPAKPIETSAEPIAPEPAAAPSEAQPKPLVATIAAPLPTAPKVLANPAPPAVTPQWPPSSTDDTTREIAIEVDTVALERSYLESLGFNPSELGNAIAAAAEPAAAAATAEIEMSEIEETEINESALHTAVIKVDATTLPVPIIPEAAIATASRGATAPSDTIELDFNLSNLDATATHVQMPSALNDHVEVSESRTNIVDVLKLAIDRDPHRRDLRIKLVETYYNAASGNRQAFMDVVRKLAREREYLSADEWSKVVEMGREIAPEDILFTDLVKDEDEDNVAA